MPHETTPTVIRNFVRAPIDRLGDQDVLVVVSVASNADVDLTPLNATTGADLRRSNGPPPQTALLERRTPSRPPSASTKQASSW
jgi:hypothetical protein